MGPFLNSDKLNHKGTIQLETKRFILRQFRIEDSHEAFVNWFSDEDSARYNGWNAHKSESVTRSLIAEWAGNYKSINYYNWAIVDKNNNEVIGSISVSNIKGRKKSCEIGYNVAKKRWNEGIATEVLKQVIEFLVETVGFKTIRAIHDVRNKASGRVMEKSGMVFVKNKFYFFINKQNLIMNCRIYEINKL